ALPRGVLDGLVLAGGGALDSRGLREHHEVDLGIAEIDLGILLLLGHFPAEGVEVGAHRLVVEIVPDDGQDGQAVSCHGPQARGRVHHGHGPPRAHHAAPMPWPGDAPKVRTRRPWPLSKPKGMRWSALRKLSDTPIVPSGSTRPATCAREV